ncbi:MAG: hypothetical protein U0V87_12930 [Acidobacteriota bacterium]
MSGFCRTSLALVAVCLGVGARPSWSQTTSNPATSDQDVQQADGQFPKPTPQGLEFKRLTPIDPAEWHVPDAHFRWLLSRIDQGIADKRVMRQYYWARQRLIPFTSTIPFEWREPAWDRVSRSPAPATRSNDAATISSIGRWINVGPTTIPGRVTGLARPANRPNELLAGMADGGVWRSRDNGQTWEPLSDREATLASGALAADTQDSETFYWGTGEGNGAIDNYGGIGVLRTSDGGRTWLRSSAFSGSFRGVTVNPHDRTEIWAAGDRLFRSNDSGATFARVNGGTPENGAVTVIVHPADPSKILASFWGPGLYKSGDGGTTWTPMGNGLPQGTGRTEVAICAADPNVVYVYGEVGAGDMWKSIDGGTTWTTLFTSGFDPCGGQCWYDMSLKVAPDDCNTVYIGGVDAFVSRNGGSSWTSVGAAGSYVHVDHHTMLVGPGGEVVMGSDGGVFRSTNWGQTFQNIGLGLPTTQYYGSCGSDVEAGYLFGGTQDNGSHRRRDSDGWAWVLGGDGGMCAVGGNKVIGEYQNTNLQRSLDSGSSWQDANGGIDSHDPRSWVGIIEKDPLNANTLYVGTNKVYRTLDFKNTAWKQILGPVYFSRQVTALAVSPADRNVLWVGFDFGGLYRTSQATSTGTVAFQNVKRDLPNRGIRRVQPHPTDPNSAWIVLGGYGNPKLMFTSDAGGSYVDKTGDLPDVPVNDLVIDPGDSNVLLAATDLGVLRSDDGGAHWFGFSDGLPATAVIEMFRHPADGTIIAGTHGRSMYRFRPSASTAVAVPDGGTFAGDMMRAQRTADGRLWLAWDTTRCTAQTYNLFFGELGQVASGTYSGATCGLPRSGVSVIDMPGAAETSIFFLIAGATTGGVEGPHSVDSNGVTTANNGIGFCGITTHVAAASCP